MILLITSQLAASELLNGRISAIDKVFTNNEPVILNTFPVNLSMLFWEDDLAMQTEMLNIIGNSSTGFMINPYGGHFVSSHLFGALKWYMYAYRYIEVYAPHAGTSTGDLVILNGTIDNNHGNDVVTNVGITLDIGNDCYLDFAHLNLLKTVFDEQENTGSYDFEEGELIGYTPGPNGLDFIYYTTEAFIPICPYYALSSSLQEEFEYYYDLQYQRFIASGRYPESNIDNGNSCRINNTAWGEWQHNSSKFNPWFENENDTTRYHQSVITFLHRNSTNPETYWRNPINGIDNLTSDVIGLFTDNHHAESLGDYIKAGNCIVEQISGDALAGIFEFRVIIYSDWVTSFYVLYEVEALEETYEDDILTVEYFDTLLDAEAGFTLNNISYTRYLHGWESYEPYIEPTTEPTNVSGYSIFLGQTILIVSIGVLIYIQKKKKNE